MRFVWGGVGHGGLRNGVEVEWGRGWWGGRETEGAVGEVGGWGNHLAATCQHLLRGALGALVGGWRWGWNCELARCAAHGSLPLSYPPLLQFGGCGIESSHSGAPPPPYPSPLLFVPFPSLFSFLGAAPVAAASAAPSPRLPHPPPLLLLQVRVESERRNGGVDSLGSASVPLLRLLRGPVDEWLPLELVSTGQVRAQQMPGEGGGRAVGLP